MLLTAISLSFELAFRALALLNELLQATASSLGIIVRVSNRGYLCLEVLELVIVRLDLVFCHFDLSLKTLDLHIKLLQLQSLLFVLLTLSDELIEHVL